MKKLTVLASMVLAVFFSAAAAEITMNPGDSLHLAIANAQDGDVLILNDGNYSYEKKYTIDLDKSLTIKAAHPGEALINFVCFEVPAGVQLDHIIIDGVYAEHDFSSGNYFLQVNNAGISVGKVALLNSEIRGYGRGVIRATTEGVTIDSLIVDNCIFERNSEGGAGYGTINPQKAYCKDIVIRNCTFYNQPSGILRAEGGNATDTQRLLLENCTILKCGSANGSQNMISAKNLATGSTVKNSIFSGAYVDASELLDKPINLNNNEGAVVSNCLLEGYAVDKLTKGCMVENQVEATVTDYDFANKTLNTDPKVSGIGDPRWTLNGSTSLNPAINSDKTVLSIEHFDVNGRKVIVTDNTKGILIQRITYTDGTQAARKVIK